MPARSRALCCSRWRLCRQRREAETIGTLRLTILRTPTAAAAAAGEEVLRVALLGRRVAGGRRQRERHVEAAEALPDSRADVGNYHRHL